MPEQTCDLEDPLAALERMVKGGGQNWRWKSLLQSCHRNIGYGGLSCSMAVAVGGRGGLGGGRDPDITDWGPLRTAGGS